MRELLEKSGFKNEDIEFLLSVDESVVKKIKEISDEYLAQEDRTIFMPFLERVRELACDGLSPYTLDLLFWICAAPTLKEEYISAGYGEKLFYEFMADLTYKTNECKAVTGICGIFSVWYRLFFSHQLFPAGRLNFNFKELLVDYSYGDYEFKKGDRVFGCHIPSSGKLLQEDVMNSLDRAYKFFKKNFGLEGNILPVICSSWLLYPPYHGDVFSEGSNIYNFAKNFDIVSWSETEEFLQCTLVFNKMYEGRDMKDLPSDTTLRRNFIRYFKEGKSFGSGYGILLYDGEKKEIINKK